VGATPRNRLGDVGASARSVPPPVIDSTGVQGDGVNLPKLFGPGRYAAADGILGAGYARTALVLEADGCSHRVLKRGAIRCAEGLGVTIVPTLALPAKSAGLVVLPLSPRTRRTLSVAWHRTGALPGAVAAFLAYVRTHAPAQRGPAATPTDGPCRT
jgi:hypothetical protein